MTIEEQRLEKNNQLEGSLAEFKREVLNLSKENYSTLIKEIDDLLYKHYYKKYKSIDLFYLKCDCRIGKFIICE